MGMARRPGPGPGTRAVTYDNSTSTTRGGCLALPCLPRRRRRGLRCAGLRLREGSSWVLPARYGCLLRSGGRGMPACLATGQQSTTPRIALTWLLVFFHVQPAAAPLTTVSFSLQAGSRRSSCTRSIKWWSSGLV
jgi:hypothetical protein